MKDIPLHVIMLLYLKVCDDFSSSFILDLPKLHTILFEGNYGLAGDGRYDLKTIINGHESYNNTLIMKSTLK